MKRTKAIENLRSVVKRADGVESSTLGSALYGWQAIEAARAVLEADDDVDADGRSGISDTLADAQDVYRKAGFGPDGEPLDAPDSGTDAPDPGALRLVEVEADKPTLDTMPDWERHKCKSPNENVVFLMSINGDAWYAAYPPLIKTGRRRSEYIVLDAPAPQRTVRDLRPGDVVHDEDAGWLICQFPEDGTFWQISRSRAWNLPTGQPIDKVYRFEVAS